MQVLYTAIIFLNRPDMVGDTLSRHQFDHISTPGFSRPPRHINLK